MLFFTRRIEHAFDVSVQCPHEADARKHRRAAQRHDQDQRFHRGLPFLALVNGLRKLRDVIAGIFKRDELATVGQRDWIIERPLSRTKLNPSADPDRNIRARKRSGQAIYSAGRRTTKKRQRRDTSPPTSPLN
jgi:hypothetical protein